MHFFFQRFYEKPLVVMPKIGKKNANSDKINVYYGTKELLGCPILTIFYEKITALSQICQKIVHFLKKHSSHTHI